MIQRVFLSQCASKCSTYLGKTIKRCGTPTATGTVIIPLALSALSLFIAKNGKKEKDVVMVKDLKQVDLMPIEYSASSRLKDIGNQKETFEFSNISKNNNKWNQVFRN